MFWDQFAQLVFFYCFCVSKTVFTVLVKAFGQCDYPGAQIFVLSFQHLYFLFIWKKILFLRAWFSLPSHKSRKADVW